MNIKRSPIAIEDNKGRDFDVEKDFPTLADLMREQKVSISESKTVHQRRDLDSLG